MKKTSVRKSAHSADSRTDKRRKWKKIRIPDSAKGKLELIKSLTVRINTIAEYVSGDIKRSHDNQQRYALERLVNLRARLLENLEEKPESLLLHTEALQYIHSTIQ